MIAMGLNSKQLEKLFLHIETDQLIDINTDNILSINENYGLDTGKRIEDFIKIILQKKYNNPNITMNQLFLITNIHLTFTSVNLDSNQIEYINHINYPDLPVYLGIRMSSSVPLFYNVVKYNNQHFIDGGVLLNYPISYFKENLEDTIGICVRDNATINKSIDSFTNYISKILSLMLFQINNISFNQYSKNTILIETPNTHFIDTHITEENKLKLIQKGYDRFMEWYDDYIGNDLFMKLGYNLENLIKKAQNIINNEIYIIEINDMNVLD